MTFRLRIFFAILFFVAIIFLLLLQLNRSLVGKTYDSIAETRFLFVSQSLKTALELNIGLGFPLAELRVSQDLIEREKADDDQILAIEVLDDTGRSLFSTDRGTVGEDAPADWLQALQVSSGQRWTVTERDAIVIGVPIVNDFERTVGYVALQYSKAYFDQKLTDFTESLLGWGTAILAGLAALLALGTYGTTAPPAARPRALLAIFNGDSSSDAGNDDLLNLARAAQDKITSASSYLDGRAKDLQRLDDEL
ncbi:hypothetical protein [Elstera cyanobacteriorum]|uniref:Uncharacterized protein n=1 Tax=Elstera cyanobacteriorum TaxID=2022747 RepID=A0A255XRR6_9PROT|nr:hypothetical protein [Elstera cyanobacteriorum]OYQ19679.1 hypothetical protein CHR90_06025 [Elstera cyanobacteriorum]